MTTIIKGRWDDAALDVEAHVTDLRAFYAAKPDNNVFVHYRDHDGDYQQTTVPKGEIRWFGTCEEYIANDGDRCDHCGVELPEGTPVWVDTRRYCFCSPEHAHQGPTREHSPKLRFMQGVLGKGKS